MMNNSNCLFNNKNTNTNKKNKTQAFRIGEEDLNPLTSNLPQPLFGSASSSSSSGMFGSGSGGNQVGPNNPIFHGGSGLIGSGRVNNIPPQGIVPGSRFDPIHPNAPLGEGTRPNNSSNSALGQINPDHQRPPHFEDEIL